MKPHLSKFTIRLTICAATLLLSNRLCFAAQCPDTTPVDLTPEETLNHVYQPSDGDILHRRRFVPPPPYASPYPTVLMLPPDIFKLEYGDSGVPSEKVATADLQVAGFLVFQVDHRLAPPGALDGQLYSVISGHPPQQTDDVKRQIMAALADPQCNGKIYLVGGSAGGSLALWVMLDSSATFPNCGWNDTARTKIKAVVSLSGPAQFCDWSNPGGIPPTALTQFENDLDNYVGLPPQTQDCNTLDSASPAWLVSHGATSSPPVILYATDGDPVPNAQATDMYNALKLQFPTVEVVKYIMHYLYTDPNNHAFKYFHSHNNADNSDGDCVSNQVKAFLLAHP